MLVKNLKSNVSGQLIVFSVLVLVSWPSVLLVPASDGGVSIAEMVPQLYMLSDIWQVILFLPFLLLLATYYSHVLRVNSMSKNPLFVALIFFLLMSVYLQPQMFVPALLITFLWLLALSFLFKMYDRKEPFSEVFNAGFVFGVIGWLYAPLMWACLLPFLVMIIYPISKWREWCIAALGWLCPLFWFFIYQQWIADVPRDLFFPPLKLPFWEEIANWPLALKIFSAAWLSMAFLAVGFIRFVRMDYEMAQRKKIMALMGVFIFTLLLFFVGSADYTLLAINFALSAFFIAEAILKLKIPALADSIFYVLVAGLIAMNWCGR